MRSYVDYSLWSNEFQIDATLTLDDDGRFLYSEDWHCYGAGFLKSADGTWRQDGEMIFLHCDSSAEGIFLSWFAGGEKRAIDSKDSICIDGNFTMSLSEEKPAPKPAEVKLEPFQFIAKLHFKDGRILKRLLPKTLPDALFTQTFYRLVDEISERTFVFKARESSENSDSPFLDYDEISTENSYD